MEIVRYQAAGGIVFDRDQVLLLRKPALGEMVLPKGHVEPGETAEATALRETREETGYTNLEVLADLGEAEAQYAREGKWYIRTEHYYLMRLVNHDRGPVGDYDDAEHDQATFERVWTPVDEAAAQLSFEPARSFVGRAVQWWKKNWQI